jgi:hypothetical protein
MKMNLLPVLAGAGMVLSGCATWNRGVVLAPVGPGPVARVNLSATNGTLVVYSAHECNADFNSRDSSRKEFSDYEILGVRGDLRERVQNDSGTILQRPVGVELPAGNYEVVAQANGYGMVRVPVTIEAGRDTIIHLEGDVKWPNQFGLNATNAVCLPHGEIVGWRSTVAVK